MPEHGEHSPPADSGELSRLIPDAVSAGNVERCDGTVNLPEAPNADLEA